IGNEAGPRQAAAREKRERMDALRKTLGDGGGSGSGEHAGDAKGPGGSDEAKGPREGGRGNSKTTHAEAEKETALAGDIRALYLLLARALHPDKEADPAR